MKGTLALPTQPLLHLMNVFCIFLATSYVRDALLRLGDLNGLLISNFHFSTFSILSRQSNADNVQVSLNSYVHLMASLCSVKPFLSFSSCHTRTAAAVHHV